MQVFHSPLAPPQNTGMDKPAIKDVLERLMEREGIKNGTQLVQMVSKAIAPDEINQPTVWRILSGKTENPSLKTVKTLAAFFNVTVSELIGETTLGERKANIVLQVMQDLPEYKKDVLVSTARALAESKSNKEEH